MDYLEILVLVLDFEVLILQLLCEYIYCLFISQIVIHLLWTDWMLLFEIGWHGDMASTWSSNI